MSKSPISARSTLMELFVVPSRLDFLGVVPDSVVVVVPLESMQMPPAISRKRFSVTSLYCHSVGS